MVLVIGYEEDGNPLALGARQTQFDSEVPDVMKWEAPIVNMDRVGLGWWGPKQNIISLGGLTDAQTQISHILKKNRCKQHSCTKLRTKDKYNPYCTKHSEINNFYENRKIANGGYSLTVKH